MSKAFIDTNVVVYANDAADTGKQNTAISLITRALSEGWGVVSTQVMMEYAAVASNRLGQPRDAVTRQTFVLERFEVVAVSPEIIRNGLEFAAQYRLSLWDGVILAAAHAARCDLLYSEDFAAGRLYAGIEVRNPFT
ncbi:MAG: PIN domain-containing protein [Spirochaetaceae bacterium]